MTTGTDIVHVDARHIVPSSANKGHGGDITIETYDGRSVLANVAMIRQLIPGTDKGNDFEITAFLQFCMANKYDPFRKQVYFIKYKPTDPASWVVSYHVYLDRASRHPRYDGYQAGIVWQVGDNRIRGRACDFTPPEAAIVGGWARVYRKDRKHPAEVEVPLSEMQNTYAPIWSKMTTTMATKTPLCRALRAAFPEELGHTYAEGEIVAEASDVSAIVPTREERAESPVLGLSDVAAAVEAMLAEPNTTPETVASILQKVAARATGREPGEFDDDAAWTHDVAVLCLESLEAVGLELNWLTGEEVDDVDAS